MIDGGLSVLLLHAHPDDESLFTGALARRLADRGHHVHLLTATGGELGTARRRLVNRSRVRRRRLGELRRAAAVLGIESVGLLGYRDSGMPGDPAHQHAEAFVGTDLAAAATRVVAELDRVRADVLVHYDDTGIYGHPDHLMVHRVGRLAVTQTAIPSYECALEREYLAQHGPHYVEGPRAAGEPVVVGRPRAELTAVLVPSREEVAAKRDALRAHGSQLGPAVVDYPDFAARYGPEWFVRCGEAVFEQRHIVEAC